MESELSKQLSELKLMYDRVITPVTVPLQAHESVMAITVELK